MLEHLSNNPLSVLCSSSVENSLAQVDSMDETQVERIQQLESFKRYFKNSRNRSKLPMFSSNFVTICFAMYFRFCLLRSEKANIEETKVMWNYLLNQTVLSLFSCFYFIIHLVWSLSTSGQFVRLPSKILPHFKMSSCFCNTTPRTFTWETGLSYKVKIKLILQLKFFNYIHVYKVNVNEVLNEETAYLHLKEAYFKSLIFPKK